MIENVIANLEILEFTIPASRVFAKMTAHLQALGRPVGDMDVLMAATAVASGHQVVITRNPRHFADLPGVVVESHGG